MKKKITLMELSLISVMTAAVYVASAFLQIPVPTPIGSTRLHMGNVMCLLSGMLLGSWQGGLAAGLGSMLFDLTSPAYISSAPFTFLFKFLISW
ncbi:MAG: ECF transporter S component, partial [Lachnospiraceae bacterium]|nr:ECF transporter S component [Lachnospiraceae bacterium]